ncbi:hypothetical protein Cni_G10788 [Canna indica]|uniref:Uncharacterized protein n=1 Tax=Canna indica TaxID=4628 RepID=A0AAQ3Q8W6_9LILI|nr:hypothetical protein Cni_G10788 [Canna indica]
MESYSKAVTLLFILFISSAPSLHARKLLGEEKNKAGPALEAAGLVFNMLPRGSVPPSAPGKGGNGVGTAAVHGYSTERMLGSVPSPGIGH